HLRHEGRWDPTMRRAVTRARSQLTTGFRPMARARRGLDLATQATGSAFRGARLAAHHGRLTATGRLRRVAIDNICDEFAFSLAPTGWEPISQILRSHRDDRTTEVEQTPFGRFMADPATNRVRDLNDLLHLGDTPPGFADLPRFWLGTYPWGGIEPDEIGRSGPAFGWAHDEATGIDTSELWGRGRTIWYRPDDPFTIAAERDRTIALERSMASGYRPLRARGFPLVTILRHDDGRRRAVIVDGHHRLAVLAHRGARSAVVEVGAVIDRGAAGDWFHVRRGHCTPAQAFQFFDAFFQLDGSERFRAVTARWEVNRVR
ncbi:MAG: hypothetical protein AAFN30_18915, partial [Actinomycetota bacterium]